MRRSLRTTLGMGVSVALAAVLTLPVTAAASQASTQPAPVQDFLAGGLAQLGPLGRPCSCTAPTSPRPGGQWPPVV